VKENGGKIIDFETARKSIQIRKWEKFFKTPEGKDYMRLVEDRVERIDDPEVPSIYKISKLKGK
jgi:hypothetical protein